MIEKFKAGIQGGLIVTTVFSLALHGCSGEQQDSFRQPAAVGDQTVYEWKMITSWPKNLPALGTLPEYFAEIVEKMKIGRASGRERV